MRTTPRRFLPESLELAVPEIDAEHDGIFHLLAGLKDVSVTGNQLDADTAARMLDQIREHFDTEERLAKEAEQDFSAHAEKHDELLQTVVKLLEKMQDGQANVFDLLRYVEYWCERHITDDDKLLAADLRGGSRGDRFECSELLNS